MKRLCNTRPSTLHSEASGPVSMRYTMSVGWTIMPRTVGPGFTAQGLGPQMEEWADPVKGLLPRPPSVPTSQWEAPE